MRVHLDELPGDAHAVQCVDLRLPDLNAWTVGGRTSGELWLGATALRASCAFGRVSVPIWPSSQKSDLTGTVKVEGEIRAKVQFVLDSSDRRGIDKALIHTRIIFESSRAP